MATTEVEKIPETVLSRSQVYEFRTIGTRAIGDQLRKIVDAEGIDVSEDSLQLIARDADGSMRDAQSKLDQVIAFTGQTIGPEDVATVLGLVGRDLVLDAVQAVVDDDAPAAFVLAGNAVEMGYDLRLVCRELSRLVRDLLVLSVDPARVNDPEIAGESERSRLLDLSKRFSREDLLRAFDLLTRAESDIRGAAQPRYHLEMALLRWIYLRKMVGIDEVIANLGAAAVPRALPPSASRAAGAGMSGTSRATVGSGFNRTSPSADREPSAPAESRPAPPVETRVAPRVDTRTLQPGDVNVKDALLSEIRKTKGVFYNTVVAQAQKIEMTADRVAFTFSAAQRTLRDMFEQNRGWLETIAQQIAGRRIAVASLQSDGAVPAPPVDDQSQSAVDKKVALREQALADAGVQALLDVFPAEIRDVEEM
jgi:DNA polymerase-3 subunit gamma/tau